MRHRSSRPRPGRRAGLLSSDSSGRGDVSRRGRPVGELGPRDRRDTGAAVDEVRARPRGASESNRPGRGTSRRMRPPALGKVHEARTLGGRRAGFGGCSRPRACSVRPLAARRCPAAASTLGGDPGRESGSDLRSADQTSFGVAREVCATAARVGKLRTPIWADRRSELDRRSEQSTKGVKGCAT